jgi:hypothetical protein
MITPDAPASIHHLFPLMAPLAFSSLNDVALVALSITGSTLAAKRSAFVLVEDDAVTLRLPELWGAPWLRARKLALPHPVRGRDGRYRPPPAQNRASGIPARGSHLGCVTAKRICGHG